MSDDDTNNCPIEHCYGAPCQEALSGSMHKAKLVIEALHTVLGAPPMSLEVLREACRILYIDRECVRRQVSEPRIVLVHHDGTRVPLLGMRSTRTGQLRPPTDEEIAALRVQWARFGDPRVRVESAAE